MKLEICASSLESAQAALKGGAHRIELCEDLAIGGITPSKKLLRKVVDEINLETHVLIRPRGGNFCYLPTELNIMVKDINNAKEAGAAGVVFGALKPNNTLDIVALEQLMVAASGLECSFHKAFDQLIHHEKAIEALIDLGFTRILTSGGKATAIQGLSSLLEWHSNFGQKIEIMPGGSIRPENIHHFLGHDLKSIHSAAIPKGGKHTDYQTVASLKESITASAT
jgi:copper homeostasis protein